MNGGTEFEVDLDALADYAAGLLDGTPRGAEVARLVATDPTWAGTLAALRAAEPAVRADLAAVAADIEPMPADVVARLDAALQERPVASLAEARHRRSLTEAPHRRANTSRRPSTSRRRWAAVAAAAAGIVTFGVFGVAALRDSGDAEFASSKPGAADAPARGQDSMGLAAPETPLGAGGPTVTASGLDYQRSMVDAWASGGVRKLEDTPNLAPGAPAETAQANPPAALARLRDPTTLRECLTMISVAVPGRPVSIDYARFEGSAALVVALAEPTRTVVVGPACGLPGSGADLRYQSG